MRPFPFFYRFFEAREESSFVISLLDAAARVSARAIEFVFHEKFRVDENLNVRKNQDGGRGGIRTHGGLPHARFRVECLKPDSATLPFFANRRSPALIINCAGVIVNSGLRKTGDTKMLQF
jgi:hypothetical protein